MSNFIQKVFSDEQLMYVITSKGLYAFGANAWGKLGLGNSKEVKTPTLIHQASFDNAEILDVRYEHARTIVHTSKGLYTFGYNSYGQLGLGHREEVKTPTLIPPESFDNAEIYQSIISSIEI